MIDVIQNAICIIQFIVKLHKDVVCNKSQCARLINRIQNILPSLNRLNEQQISNQLILRQLQRFYEFLSEVKVFVHKFTDKNYVLKVLNKNIDHETFEDLNENLTEYINNLQFGIVCNTFEQHKEDLVDREKDQEDLKLHVNLMKDELRVMNVINHAEILDNFDRMHQMQLQHIAEQKELQAKLSEKQEVPKEIKHKLIFDEDMVQLLVQQIQAVQLKKDEEGSMKNSGSNSANSTGSTKLQEESARNTPGKSLPALQTVSNDQIDCSRVGDSLLGSGGFGDVYSGTMIGTKVAIKYLRDSSPVTLKALQKEALILQIISTHPAIIRFFGAQIESPPYFLVMEYAICSLYDLLYPAEKDEQARNNIMTQISFLNKEEIARKVQTLYECSCALQHLHALHVTHRDIKPMNILISSEGKAKLTDFGLARVKHLAVTQSSMGTQKGTPVYMPPEILLAEDEETIEYNEKTDMYGFGVLLNEVLDHAKPFPGLKMNQVMSKLMRDAEVRPLLFGRDEDLFTSGNGIILELQMLIQRCWHVEAASRPVFQSVAQKLSRIGKACGSIVIQSRIDAPKQIDPIGTSSKQNSGSTGATQPELYNIPSSPISPQRTENVLSPPPSIPFTAFGLTPAELYALYEQTCCSVQSAYSTLQAAVSERSLIAKGLIMLLLYKEQSYIVHVDTTQSQSYARELLPVFESVTGCSEVEGKFAKYLLGQIYCDGIGASKNQEKGFAYIKEAADFGLPFAQAKTGTCYSEGVGVTKNASLGYIFSKRAADQGDLLGLYNLAWHLDNGVGTVKDSYAAFAHYKRLGDMGYYGVFSIVANFYEEGLGGVTKDLNEAKKWFQKGKEVKDSYCIRGLERVDRAVREAAIAKAKPPAPVIPPTPPTPPTPPPPAPPALSTPSELNKLCDQVRCNNRSALTTIEGQVAKNNKFAKAFMMTLLNSDLSFLVSVDKPRAEGLSRELVPFLEEKLRSSGEELNYAKHFLGRILCDGIGATKNATRGVTLLKEAADAGLARAQLSVGYYYSEGVGVAKNDTTGYQYTKRAADQGDIQGFSNMGWYLKNGVGVTKDVNAAYTYYKRAADAGFRDAFSCIGVYYEEGVGNIAKDLNEAKKWFLKGKDLNDSYCIRGLERIEKLLKAQATPASTTPAATPASTAPAASTGISPRDLSLLSDQVRCNNRSALTTIEGQVAKNNKFAKAFMMTLLNSDMSFLVPVDKPRAEGLSRELVPFLEEKLRSSGDELMFAKHFLGRILCDGVGITKDASRGLTLLKSAADLGLARSQLSVGYYYSEGIGVTKDTTIGYQYTKRAVDQGDIQGYCNIGWCLKNGVGVAKDVNAAFTYYKRAADAGFRDAFSCVGVYYEEGVGNIAKDLNEAKKWFLKGKDLNDSYCIRGLARVEKAQQGASSVPASYRTINPSHTPVVEISDLFCSIRLNRREALQSMERQQQLGNLWATSQLAILFFVGVHICTKDTSKAIRFGNESRPFLEYKVQNGNSNEQGYAGTILARFYFEGISVTKDNNRCFSYANTAKDTGVIRAVGTIGFYLAQGIGCTSNLTEACRYTKRAAEAGDFQSMHNLGWNYENGSGVTKDPAAALQWYKRAADIGFVDSQDNTGFCYEKGKGCAVDIEEARKYYQLAAAQGSDYSTRALNRLPPPPAPKSGIFKRMFG